MKQKNITSRLDKYLSNCGYGTRSQTTRLIKKGIVTVNGERVQKASHKVHSDDEVRVDEVVAVAEPPVFLWHKPVGVHSTIGDPLGRLSITECEPNVLLPRYHPVGRLDADTSGLLLFSKLGALTQRLLHPKHEIPRRYCATSVLSFTDVQRAAIESGVETSLGVFSGRVTRLEGKTVELIVTEGKHRMVRRMLANVQRPVETLTRLEYGPFSLGELPLGELRPPTDTEWMVAQTMGLPGF